jgi:hypothetical protein
MAGWQVSIGRIGRWIIDQQDVKSRVSVKATFGFARVVATEIAKVWSELQHKHLNDDVIHPGYAVVLGGHRL